MTKTSPEVGSAYLGAAWLNPESMEIFSGRMVDNGPYMKGKGKAYKGAGIVVDVSTIQASNVLEQLLGLAEQQYKLDACCTVQSAPNLLLRVDADTMGYGQEKVGFLEESEIVDEEFAAVNYDLWLNEVHVVVEDKAAKQAAHDLMAFKVAKAAKRLARMRNSQIATELHTATEIATGQEWDDMTNGVSDHNPLEKITYAITVIECNGFPVNFMAVSPTNWAEFLANTKVAAMVQAGLLNAGATPSISLPGWPTVKVIVDCAITEGLAIVGSSDAIILAEGPTETVKYRNELKRYTGFVTRQYMQPEIVEAGAIRELTGISP